MIRKCQEIPLAHPESECMFDNRGEVPFVATPGAIDMVGGSESLLCCLTQLRELAIRHNGLDRIQVFSDDEWSSDVVHRKF